MEELQDPFDNAPISHLLGLEVLPGLPGSAEVLLAVDERMHNPMGFVHGGVIALLADAAMGIAFGRTLDEKHAFATVEMKTSFIRPIKKGKLQATATLVQRGLRIGFVNCRITNQSSKLIATASCTCTVNSLD